MSELEILRSEIEALRLENQSLKKENQKLLKYNEAIKRKSEGRLKQIQALQKAQQKTLERYRDIDEEISELKSKLAWETSRCDDCHCYGAEERDIHYRGGVKLCDDCDRKENARYMRRKGGGW